MLNFKAISVGTTETLPNKAATHRFIATYLIFKFPILNSSGRAVPCIVGSWMRLSFSSLFIICKFIQFNSIKTNYT